MFAIVFSELLAEKEKQVYSQASDRPWREQFLRLAARIAVNRVIAGVHFPIDNAAGMVLGVQLGRYFSSLATTGAPVPGWEFNSAQYGEEDFPWRNIITTLLQSPPGNVPVEVPAQSGDGTEKTEPNYLTRLDVESAPQQSRYAPNSLGWLWEKAKKEWR
jgi:hypothetical protein